MMKDAITEEVLSRMPKGSTISVCEHSMCHSV